MQVQAFKYALIVTMVLVSRGAIAADGTDGTVLALSGPPVVTTKDTVEGPDALCDGDAATECVMTRNPGLAGNIDVAVTLNLAEPSVVEAVEIVNGQSAPVRWVHEIEVGSEDTFRPLLGRMVNLPMWRGGDRVTIPVMPAAAAQVRITFGGVRDGAITEVRVLGRANVLERHMLCWSGNLQRDYVDKVEYLDKELGVTDLWLDAVETAFPQTVTNAGFDIWTDSGVLESFRERGIRYWLTEHESFGFLIRRPEYLHDDLRWETTLREMRRIYGRARTLGFRGLVFDAECYVGVPGDVKEAYEGKADHVDAWCFVDEFGYAGGYYQRGKQVGAVIREVWPEAPLMQLYEARMYAGIPGCRDGNYWWLKGIHDAGVEVWIATEKTYGAGNDEIDGPEMLDHLNSWFVRLPEFIPKAHAAFPFATRILPGFHPWNSRTKMPHYLPKYLDEQLRQAHDITRGYWIYCEGNPSAGDPRVVIDPAQCEKYSIEAEDYLKVFQAYPTTRTP
ncbi:MAG: hypothetical protein GY851_27925 [bacterium]|nr:hypothetical protein [bacterium]